MSRSEIRSSQITALLEKVRKLNYEKYLRAVRLTKVRGFSGGEVSFDFPVTALVGPNGGGKSNGAGGGFMRLQRDKARNVLSEKFDWRQFNGGLVP